MRNGGAEVGYAHMGVLDGAGGVDVGRGYGRIFTDDASPRHVSVAGAVDRALTPLGSGEVDGHWVWLNIQSAQGIWPKVV